MNLDDKTKQLLSAYYDGEATGHEKELAEKLIAENPECKKFYESLQALSSSMDTWKDENLSADLEQKIYKGMYGLDTKTSPASDERTPILVAVGSGILMTIVCFTVFSQIYLKNATQEVPQLAKEYPTSEATQARETMIASGKARISEGRQSAAETVEMGWSEIASTDKPSEAYLFGDEAGERSGLLEDVTKREKGATKLAPAKPAVPMAPKSSVSYNQKRIDSVSSIEKVSEKQPLPPLDPIFAETEVEDEKNKVEYQPYYLESDYEVEGQKVQDKEESKQVATRGLMTNRALLSIGSVQTNRTRAKDGYQLFKYDDSLGEMEEGKDVRRARVENGAVTVDRQELDKDALVTGLKILKPVGGGAGQSADINGAVGGFYEAPSVSMKAADNITIITRVNPSPVNPNYRIIQIDLAGRDPTSDVILPIAKDVELTIKLNPEFIKAHRLLLKSIEEEFITDTFFIQYELTESMREGELQTISFEVVLRDTGGEPHPKSFRYGAAEKYHNALLFLMLEYTDPSMQYSTRTIRHDVDASAIFVK